MSTSAITTSLFSQIAGSDGTTNQFVTDLNQLAQDVQSGNLSSAQQDYVPLSQDALNGVSSSPSTTSASGITTSILSDIASSSSGSSTFVNDLNQLGTDLENGNLSGAQQDLLNLDSTALNAASSAPSSTTTAAAGKTNTANSAQAGELIQAIVQAMSSGNDSAVSSGLSELASVSTSAAGASILQQESESYGSATSSSLAASSITELLQGLNPGNSTSTLSLLT